MKLRRLAILLTAALSCACASDDGGDGAGAGGSGGAGGGASGGSAGQAGAPWDPAAVDCTDPPQYADVAAFKKCTMCHSSERSESQRSGAPAAINFNSEMSASAYVQAIETVVSGGIMPPRTSGITLTATEKQQLLTWAACTSQSSD